MSLLNSSSTALRTAKSAEDFETGIRRAVAESKDFDEVDAEKVDLFVAILIENADELEELDSAEEIQKRYFGEVAQDEEDEILIQLLVTLCEENQLVVLKKTEEGGNATNSEGKSTADADHHRPKDKNNFHSEKSAEKSSIGKNNTRRIVPKHVNKNFTKQAADLGLLGDRRTTTTKADDKKNSDDLPPKTTTWESKGQRAFREQVQEVQKVLLKEEQQKIEEEQKQKSLQKYFESGTTTTINTNSKDWNAPRSLTNSDQNKQLSIADVTKSRVFETEEEEKQYAEECIDEVKDYLRQVSEPVTLFGESTWDRYLRYKEVELAHKDLSKTMTDSLTGGLTVAAALKKEKLHDMVVLGEEDEETPTGVSPGAASANRLQNAFAGVIGDSRTEASAGGDEIDAHQSKDVDTAGKRTADVLLPPGSRDSDESVFDSDEEEEDPAEKKRRTESERCSAVAEWLRATLKNWETDLGATHTAVNVEDLSSMVIGGSNGTANQQGENRRGEITSEGTTTAANTNSGAESPERQAREERQTRAIADSIKRAKKFTKQQYREAKLCLKPLRKKLKEKQLESAILDKLAIMVQYCNVNDYTSANSEYMKLAIGNAAWPLGVTSVGIHERANRSAIGEDKIAHVLSDEATRKYIHSFKRLIGYAQERADTGRVSERT
ncbi:unnamed protein product [Amoebophrya sp. A120]|nr:unnamed protein product [Amoebophrya sp. A120]|eukprot:GSA120T00010818001.1